MQLKQGCVGTCWSGCCLLALCCSSSVLQQAPQLPSVLPAAWILTSFCCPQGLLGCRFSRWRVDSPRAGLFHLNFQVRLGMLRHLLYVIPHIMQLHRSCLQTRIKKCISACWRPSLAFAVMTLTDLWWQNKPCATRLHCSCGRCL